ncbi:Panacea domain-containing protein [Vibrio sp. 10N.261.46.A3]|uniref:Panacea domain-containing protein n=1 Tax=Vibrio sp. 10N.261.46.A3 TaxID=3229658 RepID=UPI003552ED94
MAYSSKSVAARFTQLATIKHTSLTQMQLQKLVYIAHGYKLALTAGEPLVVNGVCAWQYGPVFPELYHSLKHYRDQGVPRFVETELLAPLDVSIITAVFNAYSHYSGVKLSQLTHMVGTPWYRTWHEGDGCNRPNTIIPDDVIMNYYRDLFAQNNTTAMA